VFFAEHTRVFCLPKAAANWSHPSSPAGAFPLAPYLLAPLRLRAQGEPSESLFLIRDGRVDLVHSYDEFQRANRSAWSSAPASPDKLASPVRAGLRQAHRGSLELPGASGEAGAAVGVGGAWGSSAISGQRGARDFGTVVASLTTDEYFGERSLLQRNEPCKVGELAQGGSFAATRGRRTRARSRTYKLLSHGRRGRDGTAPRTLHGVRLIPPAQALVHQGTGRAVLPPLALMPQCTFSPEQRPRCRW